MPKKANKPQPRRTTTKKLFRIRLSPDERTAIDRCAEAYGLPLATWARWMLLKCPPDMFYDFLEVRWWLAARRGGRDKFLLIPLTDDERQRADQLARDEELATSTWARVQLLTIAELGTDDKTRAFVMRRITAWRSK
jgi:hypothetical protein